jgi:hypothetical protein
MNSNKETISRLKFIGKIQIGDKIDLKNMHLQTDGLFTQISRTINQENRNKTLVFIQDTINKAFEILKCYEKSTKNSDKIMCLNILNDLKSSKNGLLNLKETYSFDIKFCCDIDVLLEMIEAKLIELDNIFEYSNLIEDAESLPPPPSFHKSFSEDR